MFINQKAVKDFCHEHGKRASKEFIELLDAHIQRKLEAAIKVHNGGKITLDPPVAGYIGLTK